MKLSVHFTHREIRSIKEMMEGFVGHEIKPLSQKPCGVISFRYTTNLDGVTAEMQIFENLIIDVCNIARKNTGTILNLVNIVKSGFNLLKNTFDSIRDDFKYIDEKYSKIEKELGYYPAKRDVA